MALFSFGKIRRTRDGSYTIRLEGWERDLLRRLPSQLRDLLATDDPALERLFPPAYVDDDERNDEYRRLMQGDLVAKRLSSLDVLEESIDATRLDEDQLLAWMGALNDLRLVLGTQLDVSEDLYEEGVPDDDPRALEFAVFAYLGTLLESVVEALAS